MGRKLYEEWAAYWPDHTGEEADFADFLKHVDTYLVSDTLEEASWDNTTIVSGDMPLRDGIVGAARCA